MRTINVIGNTASGAVCIEELDDQGTVKLTAAGTITLARADVEELATYLNDLLRETRDNVPARKDDWFI